VSVVKRDVLGRPTDRNDNYIFIRVANGRDTQQHKTLKLEGGLSA